MKKTILILFAIIFAASINTQAEDFSVVYNGDTIYYKITSSTSPFTAAVTFQGSNGFHYMDEYTGIVVIPDSVLFNSNYYKVTAIGDSAFSGCFGLTSITIPNSVTSIGNNSFYYCQGLSSITFSSSVLSIGNNAFYNCRALTSISIPDSVTSIGNYSFYGCTGLTSIIIPNSVATIGNNAFSGCNALTSLTIGESVTTVGVNAFKNCTSLNIIYYNAINCNNLNECFAYKTSLDSLIIGNQVLSIPVNAFRFCNEMSFLSMGNSVTTINDYSFNNCSSLISLTIPSSVTSIGKCAFAVCNSVDTVYFNAINCSSMGNRDYPVFFNCNNLSVVIVGDSVQIIPSYAFSKCGGLTSINIPNTVTSIGEWAFSYCTSLTSITIPNTLDSISNYCFSNCSGLTSLTIPNSVTKIGLWAFYYCNGLTTLTLPSSLTFIDDDAFRDCSGLTAITSEAMLPPNIYSSSFISVDKSIPLYVRCNSLSFYQASTNWSLFTNMIGFKTVQLIDTSICQGSIYTDYCANIDSAGVYTLVSGCDSVILTLNITPIPNVPQNLILSNITSNYVTVSWQGDADSYDVYRDDSLIVNVSDTNYVDNFNFNNGQTYCYKIKAKNSIGCESALSDTNCFAIIGIENIENTNIQTNLYPNPTKDKSYLEVEGLTSEAYVLVYDMVGRLIQTHKVNQSTKHLELDMRGSEKGVYFVRIVNDSIKHTKKLIVQ